MKTSRRDFVIKSALAAAGMAYGYKSVGAINPAELKIGCDEMASLVEPGESETSNQVKTHAYEVWLRD